MRPFPILSKTLKFVIPVVVSVGLCWVMFRDIDFVEMMRIIRSECDFRWIGLMLVMSLYPLICRAMRWGIQLRAIGVNAPIHILVYSIFGTYAVNLVFPRLGEVWRTGYISYRQHSPFSGIFGSMIADRLTDTVVVGLLMLFTFFVARGPIMGFLEEYPDAYRALLGLATSPWVWGCAVMVVGGGWWVVKTSRSGWAAKVRNFVAGLWTGFMGIARMKHKGQWLALTLSLWACYFLQLYVAFYAFPMTSEMLDADGILVVLVCFVLTSISMGVPSNGGIGPYQATMIFGLRVFMPAGMSSASFMTQAAAFGNVLIAAQTLFLVFLGLLTFVLIAIDRRRHPNGAPLPAKQ